MPDAPAETKVCPKCGGVMEQGKIKPVSQVPGLLVGSATVGSQRWFNGSEPADVKHGQRIQAFACTKCGYLESYLEK